MTTVSAMLGKLTVSSDPNTPQSLVTSQQTNVFILNLVPYGYDPKVNPSLMQLIQYHMVNNESRHWQIDFLSILVFDDGCAL